jgi:hypothetical protein
MHVLHAFPACRFAVTAVEPTPYPKTTNAALLLLLLCRGAAPQAKAALKELGATYEAVELNEMGKEGLQLRAELAEVCLCV